MTVPGLLNQALLQGGLVRPPIFGYGSMRGGASPYAPASAGMALGSAPGEPPPGLMLPGNPTAHGVRPSCHHKPLPYPVASLSAHGFAAFGLSLVSDSPRGIRSNLKVAQELSSTVPSHECLVHPLKAQWTACSIPDTWRRCVLSSPCVSVLRHQLCWISVLRCIPKKSLAWSLTQYSPACNV